jgi:hypothetical protein
VLIFSAQVEGSGVLEVWRKDDGFITSLSWKLYTKVPGVECDKGEFEVVGNEVFLSELVEAVYSITEAASVTDMFPSEGCQGCY